MMTPGEMKWLVDIDWRREGPWMELWLREGDGAWEYIGRCRDDTPLFELLDTSFELRACASLEDALRRLADTRLMGERLAPYRTPFWWATMTAPEDDH